jgi:hypothetical protein
VDELRLLERLTLLYSGARRRIGVNGRHGPRKSRSARSPHTLKEVRMSELSNPRGVRQPTVVRPSPEREWLTYAEAGEMVKLRRGEGGRCR